MASIDTETDKAPEDPAQAWDQRVEGLLGRLPDAVASRIRWLRHPDRRIIRIGAAILLTLGGVFSILPVLGIWMLPLGLALLAEDWPGLKPRLETAALFVERLWHKIRPGKA